jgi:hypothetical protein
MIDALTSAGHLCGTIRRMKCPVPNSRAVCRKAVQAMIKAGMDS